MCDLGHLKMIVATVNVFSATEKDHDRWKVLLANEKWSWSLQSWSCPLEKRSAIKQLLIATDRVISATEKVI